MKKNDIFLSLIMLALLTSCGAGVDPAATSSSPTSSAFVISGTGKAPGSSSSGSISASASKAVTKARSQCQQGGGSTATVADIVAVGFEVKCYNKAGTQVGTTAKIGRASCRERV